MPAANDIRKGQVIKHNGEAHLVMETQHRTPGNLRAFVQVKMRNLRYGKALDQRFASTETIEVLPTDRRTLEFSYADRDAYAFIDPSTFDQIELTAQGGDLAVADGDDAAGKHWLHGQNLHGDPCAEEARGRPCAEPTRAAKVQAADPLRAGAADHPDPLGRPGRQAGVGRHLPPHGQGSTDRTVGDGRLTLPQGQGT